jgi:hypothetical protein
MWHNIGFLTKATVIFTEKIIITLFFKRKSPIFAPKIGENRQK